MFFDQHLNFVHRVRCRLVLFLVVLFSSLAFVRAVRFLSLVFSLFLLNWLFFFILLWFIQDHCIDWIDVYWVFFENFYFGSGAVDYCGDCVIVLEKFVQVKVFHGLKNGIFFNLLLFLKLLPDHLKVIIFHPTHDSQNNDNKKFEHNGWKYYLSEQLQFRII